MFENPCCKFSNGEIEQNLLGLAATERGANADIVLHLIVVKERKLFAGAGFESLFSYCVGKLGFSRSTAYRRKVVAEKAGDFPGMLDRLRDGRLQLCAAASVAPHLVPETAEKLLDAVIGMSHREVEVFLAKTWCARPVGAKAPQEACVSNAGTPLDFGAPGSAPEPAPARKPPQRTVVKAVSPEENRVSVTLNDKTLANLKRAKEILASKSDDEVLCRALEKLLDQIAPERRHQRRQERAARKAAPKTPNAPSKSPANMRRGSAADRDLAATRAGNQCSYVSPDGHRCESRTFIEIDHIQPWALGGPSIADNQRPLCRTHNAFCSEQFFGAWHGH